jgi:DNA-binding NarL/FixJ family response regulator
MLDGFLSGTYSRTLVGRILAARALLAEQAGDYSAADRLLETAIASEREIGDEPGLIESLTLRGVVAIARGARQLAAETLAEAFGIASMFGSKNRLAPLIEALACLASSAQPAVSVELAAAARCLRQSLGAAPLPSEQARVQRYLNVARRRIGEAAYTEISREAAVVPLEATLARGRQFLHAFMSEPPGAARAAGTDTLSDREREVAMLVVRGCSNRQIAEELFITQKTVETHVSHVLTKLGLTSRVQIATWGLRHGASPPNGEPAMSAG